MSNIIRIRRRVSGAAGAPSGLKSAELAYNMADNTVYAGYGDDGSGNATAVKPIGGEGTFAKLDSPELTGTPTAPTQSSSDDSTKLATTAFVKTALSSFGAGSVTSVALSLPGSVFSVTGSPVTDSGTLTGSFTSQTANTVFAAPAGATGSPSFRTLQAADIPALPYLSSSGGTVGGDLTISGDLTVNGTTVTTNSTTLNVDDKNIELGSIASPTDATANGGGITLKGATDKTFNWNSTTGAWTSSEHIDLAAGKVYKIGEEEVLGPAALGSNVLWSALTRVGTITAGSWQGDAVGLAHGGTGADLSGAADGTIFKKTGTAFIAATAGADYLNNASVVDGGTF
jgi:hypothetical protein